MGVSYLLLGQLRKAVEALEHAVTLAGTGEMADDLYASLASAYCCAEDYVQAKRAIDQAYRCNQNKDIMELKEMIEEKLYSPVKILDGVAMEPPLKCAIKAVGYPYRFFSGEFWDYEIEAEELTESWQKAFRRGKIRGFVPIYAADDILWSGVLDKHMDISYKRFVQDRIARVQKIDHGKELLDKEFVKLTQSPDADYEMGELVGRMAGGEERKFLSNHYGSDLCLFEVPVAVPWEVLMYLPGGIWDAYLEEVTAICKYWYEKYRAVPAYVSYDVLQFVLPEPVCAEEAFEAAKEIFAFCEMTLADTKTSTLGELADSIRKSKVWYLWWD